MTATRTRILGTTRILETLGKGGMAQVYRGIQGNLQRPVAIKVMLPELSRKKDMVTRFRREAFALAALQHENIVAIYDLVEKNRQTFMIMEYIEGVDVAEVLRKGPLPLDIALIINVGVARALEHAHFRKVIHRDIKPSNVMLSKYGQVKLTDFGIAKDLTIDDMTRTGMVVGTPSYLSPEQLHGKRADYRSDIYALGVLLLKCLTGKKPFRAKTTSELFSAIAKGERFRIRDIVPDFPRSIEKIVDRCLNTDPDKRWRRAADVRGQLERQLQNVLEGTPSARLVTFLYEQGHISTKHMNTLDFEDLSFFDASIPISVTKTNGKSDDLPSVQVEFSGAERRFSSIRAKLALVFALFVGVVIAICFFAPHWALQVISGILEWLTGLFLDPGDKSNVALISQTIAPFVNLIS